MSCDDLEFWRSQKVNAESVLCPMYGEGIFLCLTVSFLGVSHAAANEVAGCRPLPVSWNNPADSPSW